MSFEPDFITKMMEEENRRLNPTEPKIPIFIERAMKRIREEKAKEQAALALNDNEEKSANTQSAQPANKSICRTQIYLSQKRKNGAEQPTAQQSISEQSRIQDSFAKKQIAYITDKSNTVIKVEAESMEQLFDKLKLFDLNKENGLFDWNRVCIVPAIENENENGLN